MKHSLMVKKQTVKNTTYAYGFHKKESSVFKTPKGINQKIVESISDHKNEPSWMTKIRVEAYQIFKNYEL